MIGVWRLTVIAALLVLLVDLSLLLTYPDEPAVHWLGWGAIPTLSAVLVLLLLRPRSWLLMAMAALLSIASLFYSLLMTLLLTPFFIWPAALDCFAVLLAWDSRFGKRATLEGK